MDVCSLYPNIDHEEGALACRQALDKRKDKSVPSDYISDIILFILRSNTLKFKEKYFHQVKGTAMGTPMAVNFANLFMSKFETELLENFYKDQGIKPLSWIRYIDDIFFIWKGDLVSLQNFLSYCNTFAEKKGYKSKIKFTSEFSKTEVVFLDKRVKIHEQQSLITELHCKPTATHTYLHRLSDHPDHTIRSTHSRSLSEFEEFALSS